MPEEHNCLILTSQHVPKVRYSIHAIYKPLPHCTESLEHDVVEAFC